MFKEGGGVYNVIWAYCSVIYILLNKLFVNHIYRIHGIPTFPASTPILGRIYCVTASYGGGLLPMDQTQQMMFLVWAYTPSQSA